MRCSPELLNAYVDGELDEPQRRLVEEHVRRCPRCSAEAAELRALKTVLAAAAAADARLEPDEERRRIAGIVGRVRFREAKRQRERTKKRFWQGAALGGAAAAVLVGAVVTSLTVLGPGTPFGAGGPDQDEQVYAAALQAVVAEHSRVALLMDMGVYDWADWPWLGWEDEP